MTKTQVAVGGAGGGSHRVASADQWLSLGGLVAAIVGAVACSQAAPSEPDPSGGGESRGPRADSRDTRDAVGLFRSHPRVLASDSPAERATHRVPALPDAAAVTFTREGDKLRARVAVERPPSAWSSTARPASVRLPLDSSKPFVIADEIRGIAVSARLVGASPSPARVDGGYVVYENALGRGGHVVHRVHFEGTEDYVYFPTRPEREEIEYEVDVGGVAGLRLVDGTSTLEFLDADGDPRLRINPPRTIDAYGTARSATLAVAGCSYDRAPRPPWERPVVKTGSESSPCRVRVGWAAPNADAYPIVVDPSWVTTGSLSIARYYHAVSRSSFTGTNAVVAGGFDGSCCAIASAEIRGDTGSWSPIGNLKTARAFAAAVLRGGGQPLLIGGIDAGGLPLGSAETLDSGGSWSPTAPLPAPMSNPQAVTVGTTAGDAVVVTNYTLAAAVFDPSALSWNDVGPVLTVGDGHALATVFQSAPNNIAVVASGGRAGPPVASATDLSFAGSATPSSNWTVIASMPQPRADHRATTLATAQRIVVAGGYSIAPTSLLADAILYDLSVDKWSSAGTMLHARTRHTFDAIPCGTISMNCALALGGRDGAQIGVGEAEIFVYDRDTWVSAGSPVVTRQLGHATVVYGNGWPGSDVLMVVGGYVTPPAITASVEMFRFQAQGANCAWDGECETLRCACGTCVANLFDVGAACGCDGACKSGHCIDGVCCDSRCAGTCIGCSAARTGDADGVCSPLVAGTDPRDECPPSGSGTCQLPGTCDGSGACGTKQSTVCSVPSCAGGSDNTLTNAATCDSTGNCAAATTTSCSAFKCSAGACLSSCGTSADCHAPNVCVGGACVAPKAQGEVCSQSGECSSGHCVDNFCCDAACLGACQTCAAAKKASGPDGVCGPIASGTTDPRCTVAGGCGADGKCDGAGACRSFAPATTNCGAVFCLTALASAGRMCDGSGSCLASGSTSCTPYVCSVATGACLQQCALTSDCALTFYCKGQTCVAVLADGAICAADGDCASAHCVQGVCCDSACTGDCSSCIANDKATGADGVCGPVKSGTDPKQRCGPGSTPCGPDGFCDGAGDCRQFASPTTPCLPDDCVTNTVAEHRCDGFGGCKAKTKTDCGAYACDALAAACKTSCSLDADCATGNFCSSNVCQPLATKGAPCSAASQCTTGFCADGFCCDAACTGQCERCSAANQAGTPGTCGPVPAGATPRSSCPSSAVSCGADGLCGANGSCRTTAPQGTACGTTCVGADSHAAKACDASGACVAGAPLTCAPYACDATSGLCKTTCAVKGDCSANAECDPANGCAPGTATCKSDGVTLVSPGGSEHSCAPYACQGGACVVKCTTTSDCAPGFDCAGESCVSKPTSDGGTAGSGGTGGAPAADVSQEKGCGCRVPGATQPGSFADIVAVAALGAALRRRRRVKRRR